jgi:hypothetical protein
VLGLSVRDDVHGRYYVDGDGDDGRPIIKSRTAHSGLDWDVILAHFTAPAPETICGIHIMSRGEECLVIVIDIDRHPKDDVDPKTNRRYAKHVYHRARALSFDCLLFDSNGRGGYHVWIVLQKMIPAHDAFRLGRWLVSDHAAFGLTKRPETFPKSPRHTGERIGAWVRLPGRHHRHDHYTRVWDDSRRVWLEGAEAIPAILRVQGKDVDIAAVVPQEFDGAEKRRRTQAHGSSSPARLSGPTLRGPHDHRRDVALAQEALRFLGADYYESYDEWVRVGMALTALGDAGLRLWHTWSAQSDKYDSVVLDQKWQSFARAGASGSVPGNHLGLGSLFLWARQSGWKPPSATPGRGRQRQRGSIKIMTTKIRTP